MLKLKLIFTLFALLLSLQVAEAKPDQPGTRVMPPSYGPGTQIFKNPAYRGIRVDKCLYSRGDRQCGKPAADRFCQLNSYRESITFDLQERAGNTFLLGSESRCNGNLCDAFRAIACKTRFNSGGGGDGGGSGSGKYFANPKVHGYMVDKCLYRGRNCGKPSADKFCQSEGYRNADSYRTTYARTSWYQKEGRVCTNNCEALTAVQCRGTGSSGGDQGGRVKVYENPKYRGSPVSECLRQGRDCGKPAATEFCRINGHDKAVSHRSVGTNARTWLLRDGRYCSGFQCRALRSVRCQDSGYDNGDNQRPGDMFYREPKYRGKRVSRCLTEGKGCGRKAADEFCRLEGYRSATSQERWRDVGPTVWLGNMRTCNKRSCDAMKNVQCSYQPPRNDDGANREREFRNPQHRGYPVSRCLYRGEGCEAEAAREFCRLNGYREMRYFRVVEDIGPTIRLGSQQLCNKRSCDGFSDITCSNY